MPVTIPMLVLGTDMAYQLGLDTKDYFTKATEKIEKRFVRKKKQGFVSVWFRTPVHLLRSSLVHYPIDDHPVGQEIICPSWRPKAKTYIFHSTNDNVVGFHNSEHLRRCWGELENVRYEFDKFGSHMKSYQRFSKTACEELGIGE